jgi:eukaryotic-like serine/threonine-protein kinase
MRLTGSFVLAQDVEIRPLTDFSEEMRRSSGGVEGDYALSRPTSRAHSKIVDSGAADLIRQFQKPSTIAQAVSRFSRTQPNGAEPAAAEKILEEALPLLRSLVVQGMLVEAGSAQAPPASESLATGENVDAWQVVRRIQSLEDTELYLVRNLAGAWGALKIARPAHLRAGRMIEHEVDFLSKHSAKNLPTLLASGMWSERPYLVTEWIRGIDVESAAAEIRRSGDPDSRGRLHALGAAILSAYADLHEHGLLHGDIHPRNLLADRAGAITILDFGLAASSAEAFRVRRGGIGFYYEPEFARAALEDARPPAASFAGEQYALAAMLYLLLTGAHTQDFKLERTEMLTQIATGAMAPFTQRGVKAWPAVEQLLNKALSRDPSDRYSSTRDFAEAWTSVEPVASLPVQAPTPLPKADCNLREIRREVLRKSAIGGEWMQEGFKTTPALAVNNGMAGLAYALLRIAIAADDGELLAAADAWSTRAVAAIDSIGSFEASTAKPNLKKVGLASLHHQRPGVFATHVLIAAARGDRVVQGRATRDFIAWGREALLQPEPAIDLTLGFAGSLLGAAMLADALLKDALVIRAELLTFGEELYAQMWKLLEGSPPVDASSDSVEPAGLANTGMAHGWAGILYASLSWRLATERVEPKSLPTDLLSRLERLADCAEPIARGLHWPWGKRTFFPGWCNGAAGHVFLWTEAYKATGDRRYLALAEGAASNSWEYPSRFASLCCGMGGQAYALLNFYRATGEKIWLDRARKLASWAAEISTRPGSQTGDEPPESRPGSLYNSLAGLAVLDADLERPLEARMPFFERD